MKARVIALALAGVYLVVVACAGEATVEPTPTSTETPTLVPSATLILSGDAYPHSACEAHNDADRAIGAHRIRHRCTGSH